MERKTSPNSDFSAQKSSTKTDDHERGRMHSYNMARPICASGGDIAVQSQMPSTPGSPNSRHCTSKNSSYHSLSLKSSEEDRYDLEQNEKLLLLPKNMDSDCEDAKRNYFNSRYKGMKFEDVNAILRSELSKYKKELKEYNTTTKDLEEKYLKINYELSEMQQNHDLFLTNRKNSIRSSESHTDSCSSSTTGSEFSLQRKYTQVFHRGSSFMAMLPAQSESLSEQPNSKCSLKAITNDVDDRKNNSSTHSNTLDIFNRPSSLTTKHSRTSRQTKHKSYKHNKENESPNKNNLETCHVHRNGELKDIYRVLKNVIDNNQKNSQHVDKQLLGHKLVDLKELQKTITTLQSEQAQFRSIIQQQQTCLNDYHSRCLKAQHIMHSQQQEIQKLNCNNQQLESEITNGIDQLRLKIDSKLKDVSHLPQMMREEQSKFEKAIKEKGQMADRMRTLQNEAGQLKVKIEELSRRKTSTINRLRAAERDLKIFKNYNTALKHEKRKLSEELQKVRQQLDTVQNASKKNMSRQREVNDKQRRELQKRVFELELKLSRSQNSTTSLIQERDSLIAELQTQLNTLVHNFEVSQKHIRVLRRHIYTMTGGNNRLTNNLLNNA